MQVELVVIEFNTVARAIRRHGPAVRDLHRITNLIFEAKAMGFKN